MGNLTLEGPHMKWNWDGHSVILLWIGLDQLLGLLFTFILIFSLILLSKGRQNRENKNKNKTNKKTEKTAVFPLKENSLPYILLLLFEKERVISEK